MSVGTITPEPTSAPSSETPAGGGVGGRSLPRRVLAGTWNQVKDFGGLGGEASCDLIERGRNGYNDLAFREVPIPPLRPFVVQECVPEMLEVKA